MSHLEPLNVMLLLFVEKVYDGTSAPRETETDFTSTVPRRVRNLNGEEFNAIVNSNIIENSERTEKSTALLHEKLGSLMTSKFGEMKTSN